VVVFPALDLNPQQVTAAPFESMIPAGMNFSASSPCQDVDQKQFIQGVANRVYTLVGRKKGW